MCMITSKLINKLFLLSYRNFLNSSFPDFFKKNVVDFLFFFLLIFFQDINDAWFVKFCVSWKCEIIQDINAALRIIERENKMRQFASRRHPQRYGLAMGQPVNVLQGMA